MCRQVVNQLEFHRGEAQRERTGNVRGFEKINRLKDALHNSCGLWQHGLGRSTALFFLPIGQAIGCEKRLVAHPDPRHHSPQELCRDP